jgi:hypothetical protein
MPFSSGILIGAIAIVFGVAMYVANKQKKAAMLVIGFGLGVVMLTFGVVALAINSGM